MPESSLTAEKVRSERKIQLAVMLSFVVIWGVLLQSVGHFKDLSWYPVLAGGRVFLALLAFVFAGVTRVRYVPNLISTYCLICMGMQSLLAVFEGSKQIEFYQYIPYFVLVSTLSLNGRYLRWLKLSLPWIVAAMVVPLFFKDPGYFSSIGNVTYNFTMPIALLFLSFLVARISSGKYEALEKYLTLQHQVIAVEAARAKLAEQVAHDIRSPLSALCAAVDYDHDPDTSKVLIRRAASRIQDIANDLLSNHRSKSKHLESSRAETLGPILLSSSIEDILAEKSRQFPSLVFTREFGSSVAFSELDESAFERALSNLIDNSVDASAKQILLKLRAEGDHAVIQVIDDGKGISPELLPKIVERGGTFNKPNGNGLGLSYAKEKVESWGGSLQIESQEGKGTTVILRLPLTPAPEWFAAMLKLQQDAPIVILDDDQSIHELWNARLSKLPGALREVHHFKSRNEIVGWFREALGANEEPFFLLDHDLKDGVETGLDIIEMLGVETSSILVTANADREDIRVRCRKRGVRLLPKNHIASVPIQIA